MLKIIFIAIIVLAIIGAATGGSDRARRKREQSYAESDARRRQIREERLAEERENLINLRKGYINHIVATNEKCKKDHNGDIYWNLEEAMLDYDKRHLKQWQEVGMTPPSFAKKQNK